MNNLKKIKSKALEVLNSHSKKGFRKYVEIEMLYDDYVVLGNSYLPEKNRSPYSVYCDTAGYVNATDFIIDNLIKENNEQTAKI